MDAEKRPQDVLAAEYALGLLEGEELLMMRGRIAREPELADAAAGWEEHFAPLSDELAGLKPPPHVWAQIEAEVEAEIKTGKRRIIQYLLSPISLSLSEAGRER
jgi:anti-sigma-K factor RskA